MSADYLASSKSSEEVSSFNYPESGFAQASQISSKSSKDPHDVFNQYLLQPQQTKEDLIEIMRQDQKAKDIGVVSTPNTTRSTSNFQRPAIQPVDKKNPDCSSSQTLPKAKQIKKCKNHNQSKYLIRRLKKIIQKTLDPQIIDVFLAILTSDNGKLNFKKLMQIVKHKQMENTSVKNQIKIWIKTHKQALEDSQSKDWQGDLVYLLQNKQSNYKSLKEMQNQKNAKKNSIIHNRGDSNGRPREFQEQDNCDQRYSERIVPEENITTIYEKMGLDRFKNQQLEILEPLSEDSLVARYQIKSKERQNDFFDSNKFQYF